MSSAEPSAEFAVAFPAFAATLRPRVVQERAVRGLATVLVNRTEPGAPDEVWLKLLKIKHGTERHTLAGWQALIDHYRTQPAHPTDLRTGA